jgi:hypothetical protein
VNLLIFMYIVCCLFLIIKCRLQGKKKPEGLFKFDCAIGYAINKLLLCSQLLHLAHGFGIHKL